MPDRYFSAVPIVGPTLTLDGNEAHHLLHVMRAKPGLELVVFDGQGGECAAEVVRCGRSTIELAVGERYNIERELSFNLSLAVALPKGDRQRWLIEKAVELGVTRLLPLQTQRSIEKQENTKKTSRYIIEASKQCGRNRLMEVSTPIAFPELLTESSKGQRLLAHPAGQPLASLDPPPRAQGEMLLAIGPEGGFTDEEVAQAGEAGWQKVGLGPRILRIETAAVALVSAITQWPR